MDGAMNRQNNDPDPMKDESDTKETKLSNVSLGRNYQGDDEESKQADRATVEHLQIWMAAIKDSIGETYDAANEPLPDIPAYRTAFNNVERFCESLFDQAARLLEDSQYKDEITQRLQRDIQDSRTPRRMEAKKVAFYGDSGVGKSSLINAILNLPYLNAQGSTGSACTCVITEFKQAAESQKTPFLADVEFHETGVIDIMLRDHYIHYFNFYVERSESSDEEELQDLELNATTAKDAFEALFSERSEFQGNQRLTDFLGSGLSEKDEKITNQLSAWASEMINSLRGETGKVLISASSAEDLSKKLEPFVELRSKLDGEESGSASYWPLIRLVHVGLNSPLLALGLVIADLPGFSDTNRTRKQTTSQYIRSCACTVVLAPIKRINTDDSVHQKLSKTLKRPGKNKLLVCTMIDDLNPATERSHQLSTSLVATKNHEILSGLYKAKKKQNVQSSMSIRKLRGKQRQDADLAISSQLLEERVLEAMVLDSLVRMRNVKVDRRIHDKYDKINRNARTLNVQFVSSQDYEAHLEGYTSSDIPLPLLTTGVPKLRSYLSALPGDDKLMILDHYYKYNLRNLLDSLTIWTSQSPLERHQQMRRVVEKPLLEVGNLVTEHIQGLRKALRDFLMEPLTETSFEDWINGALKCYESWDKMHASSFSAWCRKDGSHKTKAVSYRDWNEELLEAVKKTLTKLWGPLGKAFGDCNQRFSVRLCCLLDGLRTDLGATPGASVLPMTPFLKSLTTRSDQLLGEISIFSKAMKVARARVFDVATCSEHDSVLMEAMLPIYQELTQVKGKQKAKQSKALLKRALEKGEPYSKFQPRIDEFFEKFFEEQENILSRRLTKIFDAVLNDYDLQSVADEVPDEGRDILKEDMKHFLKDAEIRYHGVIAKEFAKALLPKAEKDGIEI